MLELDSDRWSQLNHAYGPATDIPSWLVALAKGSSDLSEAWGSLCHQHSVYPATFAAAPYIFQYAKNAATKNKIESLSFLGTVHAWRQQTDFMVAQALEKSSRSFPKTNSFQSAQVVILNCLFGQIQILVFLPHRKTLFLIQMRNEQM